MKCEQAQECVDAYIKKALPERTQEEFIKHVKGCQQCFQELETYYIVDVAIKYFDVGKEDTYDISNLLQTDLDKRLKKRRSQKYRAVVWIILLVIVMLLALMSLVNGFV